MADTTLRLLSRRGIDDRADGETTWPFSFDSRLVRGREVRRVLRCEREEAGADGLALDDGNRARPVSLPPEALHDACQRVKKVLLGDFNGDGWVDLIHAVVVPSQAGVSVEEPVAYLSRAGSDPAQRPSYCYAALLSRQLAPVDLASRLTVARVVARIRDRSGPQAIACQP